MRWPRRKLGYWRSRFSASCRALSRRFASISFEDLGEQGLRAGIRNRHRRPGGGTGQGQGGDRDSRRRRLRTAGWACALAVLADFGLGLFGRFVWLWFPRLPPERQRRRGGRAGESASTGVFFLNQPLAAVAHEHHGFVEDDFKPVAL